MSSEGVGRILDVKVWDVMILDVMTLDVIPDRRFAPSGVTEGWSS